MSKNYTPKKMQPHHKAALKLIENGITKEAFWDEIGMSPDYIRAQLVGMGYKNLPTFIRKNKSPDKRKKIKARTVYKKCGYNGCRAEIPSTDEACLKCYSIMLAGRPPESDRVIGI
jgi:hypothetical protein